MTVRALLLAVLVAGAVRAQPAPDPPADTLTVATLNLWHDRADWPVRLDLIVRDLRALGPDVLLLQEVLQKEGLPNQAQTLADALGLAHVHFVSTDPPGNVHRYGNAVVSRFPFADTSGVLLPPLDAYRTAALARLDVGGRPVRVVSTHLHHPQTAEGAGARAMEIRHLLAALEAEADGAPLVLGGDFNASPDAPEMRMLDPLRDLGGAGVTYGPAYDAGPGRRIDYLFDARHPGLVPVEAGRALDRPDAEGRYPSDHFSVYARFLLLR